MLGRQLGRGSAVQEALSVHTLGLKQPASTITAGMLPAASFLTLSADAGLSDERQFVAGAGLGGTDAGAGSTYTLAVNTGDGIQITSDAVAVDSTVVRTSRTLTAGSGLTGGGDLSANRTFNVGAGSGITVNADDVAVNQGFAFNWTGAQTWSNTAAFNGVSTFGGGVGSDLIPSTTDTYDLGSSLKLWRKGWLSELDAILFAQNVVSVIGGWLMVSKGEGTAVADISTGATSVNLGNTAGIAVNDFIIFRAALQVEYMQVTASLGGGSWTVTRNLDGSGANAWPAGSVFVNLGYNGKGRLELNAFDTPRISLIRQGTSYNVQTEQVRLGDLNGNWGYAAETYGLALGDYATSLPNITIDPTNGLRIRVFNGTPVIQLDTSGNADITNKLRMPGSSSAITIGSTPPTSSSAGTGIWIDRTGFYALAAGVFQVKIDAATGKLIAGAGSEVTVDSTGINIAEAAGAGTAITSPSLLKAGAGSIYGSRSGSLGSQSVILQNDVAEDIGGANPANNIRWSANLYNTAKSTRRTYLELSWDGTTALLDTDAVIQTNNSFHGVATAANQSVIQVYDTSGNSRGQFQYQSGGTYILSLRNASGVEKAFMGYDGFKVTADAANQLAIRLNDTSGTEVFQIQYQSGGYYVLAMRDSGGTQRVILNPATPGIDLAASGGVYKVNGTQVVASRKTGYTNAMTGTKNRATAYATGTITLVQLAERVGALLDDLTTHGLIGP